MKPNRIVFLLLGLWLCLIPVQSQVPDPDIDAIIHRMTLEQKVGQMFMVNLFGSDLSIIGRDLLETWHPGAVALFNSNIETPEQITRLTNTMQQTVMDAGGVPLFIATDQEGGYVQRLREGFTNWPALMLLTAANDSELAYRVGEAIARELRAVGLNMNLAPVVDLQTNLNNPIIGRRSPGAVPELTARMIDGLVRGMQERGVMATLKHFPGHGDTSDDSHISLPQVNHDRERLDEVELVPFKGGIEAGSGTVMVAHLWMTAFDPILPLPSSLSPNIVTGLLRDDLGYEGIIMTDALEMDAIDTRYSLGEAAVRAIQAGHDLIAIGPNAGELAQIQTMRDVLAAVRSGEISEGRIDASVRRILMAKAEFDVLNWSPLDPATAVERLNLEASAALIDEVFRAGATLVKDEAEIVPIEADDNIAIIFPGTWNSIRQQCSAYDVVVRWLAVTESPSASEIQTAVTLASEVEHTIVFTINAYATPEQQALVNALPSDRTFVVALFSPYDLLRFPFIAGYMTTYTLFPEAVDAACGILFGEYPPAGRLSVILD